MRSLFNFLKQVLAATLGAALFTLIFSSYLYTYLHQKIAQSFRPATELIVPNNAMLRIKLRGRIVEHILEGPRREELISLSEINTVLEAAAEDPNIQGIYIEIDRLSGGLDSLEALRQAFQKYKETSQKPIVVYAARYSDALLAFATVADHSILHPCGQVLCKGFSIHCLFYKRLLERFDIEAMVFHGGKYKVDSSPYIFDHMTEHGKAQWSKILQANHDRIVQQITTKPSVQASDLTYILAQQPLLNPEEAQKYHLIDAIGFPDAADLYFNTRLQQQDTLVFQETTEDIAIPQSKNPTDKETSSLLKQTNEEEVPLQEETPPNYITYNAYKSVLRHSASRLQPYDATSDKVAIVPLEGDIVSQDKEPHTISEELVIPLLEKYAKDDRIKAIVIIIDSLGGGAISTSNISHAIVRVKKHKPVVCLIRNTAASGGLHIAAACTQTLAASPGTLVGSLGSRMMILNLKKAAEKHLSIDTDGIKTHPHAAMDNSLFHEYTDEQKQFIQQSLEYDYKKFKEHIQAERGLTDQTLEAAAEGRIYSAEEALKFGLIDEIVPQQPLQRAIDLALELAGIDKEAQNIHVIYPKRILNLKYIGYFIRGIIGNENKAKKLLCTQKMYHAGYNLRQASQCT